MCGGSRVEVVRTANLSEFEFVLVRISGFGVPGLS